MRVHECDGHVYSEKYKANIPWCKVQLRIFPSPYDAESYCTRKGFDFSCMEYDPEKKNDAVIMAAQQIAILNEAERQIRLTYNKTVESFDRYVKLRDEARNTRNIELSFYEEQVTRLSGELWGIAKARESIHKVIDNLYKITQYKCFEPYDEEKM